MSVSVEDSEELLAQFLLPTANEMDSPCSKENKRDLNERLINRWHFTMLNDITRNTIFNKAIINGIQQLTKPIIVLDIGCGTSILSLMAIQGGADHVYCCDMSHVMIQLSESVISSNKDNITLIHNLSDNLRVPNHIPTRVSMVVTETFDAGLLGEHVIPSLRHAWKELLINNEESIVIPSSASIYITAIECKEIRKKTRLINPAIKLFNGLSIIGSCHLSNNGMTLSKEPYTTEDLSNIKGGVVLLTATKECMKFNFSNPKIPLPDPVTICLPVIKDGIVDAITIWYDLHLDNNQSLSTSPMSTTKWEQAIYPIEHHNPLIINNNDEFIINVSCNDTQILIATPLSQVNTDNTVYYIERSQLARLNDIIYINSFITAITDTLLLLTDEEDVRIIEITNGIPLLPLINNNNNNNNNIFILAICSLLYIPLLKQLTINNNNIVYINNIPPTLITTTWDCILLTDIITPQGTLSDQSITAINKIDLTDSIITPYSIDIILMGVASADMRALSSVLGTAPTLGIDIAQYINKYKITHLTDINMNTISYTQLTDIQTVHTIDWINPINVTKTISLKAIKTGNITGIIYWFILHHHGNHILSTGPSSTETHWNQSVFLTSEDISINNEQDIPIMFKLIDGYIDIIIVN